MPRAKVSFRPQAKRDILSIYRYIAAESGPEVAGGYVDRIEAACLSLTTFPERGRQRDDLRPGLRVLGFERRASLVFQVKQTEIVRPYSVWRAGSGTHPSTVVMGVLFRVTGRT